MSPEDARKFENAAAKVDKANDKVREALAKAAKDLPDEAQRKRAEDILKEAEKAYKNDIAGAADFLSKQAGALAKDMPDSPESNALKGQIDAARNDIGANLGQMNQIVASEKAAGIGPKAGAQSAVEEAAMSYVVLPCGRVIKRYSKPPPMPSAVDKGSRPDPESYLPPEFVDEHKKMFDEGVVKFVSQESIDQWGPNIGNPKGHFVLPKSVADQMIKEADGDVDKLEKLLALAPGTLGKNPQIIEADAKKAGLRLATGREDGANDQWLPGAYTGGGTPEMIADQFAKGSYKQTPFVKPPGHT